MIEQIQKQLMRKFFNKLKKPSKLTLILPIGPIFGGKDF